MLCASDENNLSIGRVKDYFLETLLFSLFVVSSCFKLPWFTGHELDQ